MQTPKPLKYTKQIHKLKLQSRYQKEKKKENKKHEDSQITHQLEMEKNKK